MSAKKVPSLVWAIAFELEKALNAAADSWIRVELPIDWPVDSAIADWLCEQFPNLAVGVLKPLAPEAFSKGSAEITADPSIMTQWRALRPRDQLPTVIVGSATGPDESGLRAAPIVVSEEMVFKTWRGALAGWLHEHAPSNTLEPAVHALIDSAELGDLDPCRLDVYFQQVFKKPDTAVSSMPSELWRVNLFPDSRLLDVGLAHAQVKQNVEMRRLVLSMGDTVADQRRLDRLKSAAGGPTRDGKTKIAKAVLAYSDSRDAGALKGAELAVLREIVNPKAPPKPPQPRPLDFFDFLDQLALADADDRRLATDQLKESWDLDSVESVDLAASLSLSDGTTVDVRFAVEPAADNYWVSGPGAEEQIVATNEVASSWRDWRPWPADGIRATASFLVESAGALDTMLGSDLFEPVVSDFLATRANLQIYERWLKGSSLPLLVLNESARDAVRDFLRAWDALIQTTLSIPSESSELIRNDLLLLEAIWGSNDGKPWCVLGSLHPYLLDPILQLADYCNAGMGTPDLGTKLSWAVDRSVPAYRILWTDDEILFLARDDDRYEYSTEHRSLHPAASTGDGIYQVAKSFLDYYPFGKSALVLTLIDPPRGGAVAKNIRRIAAEVDQLRVNVAVTRADSSQLETLGDQVHFLGRFDSVEDWLNKSPVRSHILFQFSPRQGGTATPAAIQGWGPTPGAHVAVKLSLKKTGQLAKGSKLTPFVTLEPRERNKVVVGLQSLSSINIGAPRLFEVEPMLPDEEMNHFVALQAVTEWAVLCAPSPLGLVPSRDSGGKVMYIGRESLSVYGMFVYATDLFAIRRVVTDRLKSIPAGPPNVKQVEDRLYALAVESTSGVLRMGKPKSEALWELVGLIVANENARSVS